MDRRTVYEKIYTSNNTWYFVYIVNRNCSRTEWETYDAEAFQQALEQDGFTVQEGELGYFDLIKLLEEGVLPSAYGNNPTTKYVIILFHRHLVMK